ncbi:hypothetical protein LGL55_20500 [Clostridium tagluense]|uniref:ABC-three component system protein n=1 Tax=Clostridium tagluense TaxID=360422 RepID=UPI001CF1ADDE|nr:ABC-three component system protein [Clostridium tagluense]MCB2313463.1 hypothetical protein [Clostridium tagluense]MCB2318270.1 hypothetical protein [Clostridium tagluense]MCB2323072.1 hypothetical protein [Clostridium tagluense]MCB2328054.1 hypothetical protein [Clostridium tagluense]MCB2332790.1 hypothetical protein [Clostridium tagluense]
MMAINVKDLLSRNKTEGSQSPVQEHNGHGDNVISYNMPMPISISPYKIKAAIDLIYERIDILLDNDDEFIISPEKRIKHTRKNELTGMTSTYFNTRIKPHLYLEKELDEFLKKNSNYKEKKKYTNIVRDINSKFIAYSSKFNNFDEAFEDMMTRFEEAFLQKYEEEKSEFIEILFAYMYFICDIPEIVNADAN